MCFNLFQVEMHCLSKLSHCLFHISNSSNSSNSSSKLLEHAQVLWFSARPLSERTIATHQCHADARIVQEISVQFWLYRWMRQLELVQKTFFSYIVQNWPWPESFHCIEVMLAAPLRSRAVLGPISGKDDQWKRCGPRFEDLDCMERAVREAWREVKSNMFAHFASETTEVNLDCQMNPNLWRGKSVSKEDSHSCQTTVNIEIILIRNQYLWWLSKLDSTCEIVICISRVVTFFEMIWWLLEMWSNCRSWFHCAVIQHMSLSHDYFCSVVQHTNIRIHIIYYCIYIIYII